MIGRAAALLLALLVSAATAAEADLASHVVELQVTYQTVDAGRPWARSGPGTRLAMGVVVEGPRILTSAQMILDSTLVQVGKRGGPRAFEARPVRVDPELNLALLEVDAPGFFEGLSPTPVGRGSPAGASASSVRWRNGQLEVSQSRVARVEVRSGPVSDLEHAFLLIKSDLAGGGWCEPVFAGTTLVGLTVSADEDLANALPGEAVAAFLAAAAAPGEYRGFGGWAGAWQASRDPALAAWLGLEGVPRGVVVLRTDGGASGCEALRPRDVLLALDGYEIDADGNYEHPRYGRLRFTHIPTEGHLAGDELRARVLRGGVEQEVAVKLRRYPAEVRLIPSWPAGHEPPYLVAGGLVFRELDLDYLRAWGKEWRRDADQRLLLYWELERGAQRPGRRRLVVLSQVLPAPYNIGYQDLAHLAVAAVNGQPVGSVADVAAALRRPQGRFHVVELFPNEARNEVVLDAAGLEAATASILGTYGIPSAARFEKLPPPDLPAGCAEGP